MNCNIKLPVVQADKRYFSLNYRKDGNDVWGIISDITVQNAQMFVTLRSKIKVFNHFNRPVDVYYMTNRGNELEFVKKIPPKSSANLPLNAIYTLTNELFFSVEGYSVTAIPYVWKDLLLNLSMTKILQCPASNRDRQEPFIMKVDFQYLSILFYYYYFCRFAGKLNKCITNTLISIQCLVHVIIFICDHQ